MPIPIFRLTERFAKDYTAGKDRWDLDLEPVLITWNYQAIRNEQCRRPPPFARVKGYLNPGTRRGKLTAGHADETVKATPLMNYAQLRP